MTDELKHYSPLRDLPKYKGDIISNPPLSDPEALLKMFNGYVRDRHLDQSSILKGIVPSDIHEEGYSFSDHPQLTHPFASPIDGLQAGLQVYALDGLTAPLSLGDKAPQLSLTPDKSSLVIQAGEKTVEVPLDGKPVIISSIAGDGSRAAKEDITVEPSSYKSENKANPTPVTNVTVAGLDSGQVVVQKVGKGLVVESLGGIVDIIDSLRGFNPGRPATTTRVGIRRPENTFGLNPFEEKRDKQRRRLDFSPSKESSINNPQDEKNVSVTPVNPKGNTL